MAGLRILSLHGCGTSAQIWKAQSPQESFRSFLPAEWCYEFVDGEQDCGPSDGIDAIYPPPYSCYYFFPTHNNVEAAHELIYEIMEEEGPFDAVLGFSQGAALAASMILHHQHENPFSPPLFRFAIFVNGSLPYSKTADLGVDISHVWIEQVKENDKVFTPADDDSPSDSSTDTSPSGSPNCPGTPVSDRGQLIHSFPMSRFSPRTHKDKISIPTAHIYGRNDGFRGQSMKLLELCEESTATCFEHSGAHDVPRQHEQSKKIAKAILQTFEKAQFVSA